MKNLPVKCLHLVLASFMASVLLSPACSEAQSAGDGIRYEVVSIRPSNLKTGKVDFQITPDGFVERNNTVLWLINYAFQVHILDGVQGGPPWLANEMYDVEAKVAPEDVKRYSTMTNEQKAAMLKPILEERFHFKAHTEEKMFPVYFLTVAKGGPKLTEAHPDAEGKFNTLMHTTRKPEFIGKGLTIEEMDVNLYYFSGRPIIDKTGLKGHYDFDLTWSDPAKAPTDGGAATDEGPSFFSAVEEQLGLQLKPGSAPFPVVMIETVSQPTPN
jgi:uncharacterized protein (TIGR03435 family)